MMRIKEPNTVFNPDGFDTGSQMNEPFTNIFKFLITKIVIDVISS